MGRIGWKGGRFSVDFETNEIYRGLRDWQRWTGDHVQYYRFAFDQSDVDPVYGEAAGPNGRIYFGPNLIPALHVIHVEGDNENTENGFYYNDEAHITLSFDQLRRTGLEKMDINTDNYLKDRFIYDTKVFRVTNVQILGQIQRRDIIVTIDGTQVKPSELANDVQFAQYAGSDSKLPTFKNYNQTNIDKIGLAKEMSQILPTLRDPNPNDGYGSGDYGDGDYGAPITDTTYGYGEFGYGENGYGGVT